MRKRLILDVAADSGGALVILQEYYRRAAADPAHEYTFCVSTPKLPETDNVRVLRFPWVKKSWLHRLWFDRVTLRRILQQAAPQELWSLQNLLPPFFDGPTTLYLHQPLPFIEHRFTLRENARFWVYQNVLSRGIFRSLRQADTVIVQTQWMRRAAAEKAGIEAEKIRLEPPELPVSEAVPFEAFSGEFFYPVSAMPYKNHVVILQAAAMLVERGIAGFSLAFTLSPEQLPVADKFPQLRGRIYFLGTLSHEQVLERYRTSALCFASYVETFGLPLLEAKMAGAPVLAADCSFAREILDGYEKAAFFAPDDALTLSRQMQQLLEEKVSS